MKNKTELINGIRLDIQKEQDAISTYMSQVNSTKNMKARKVLKSIADEERVHVGELTKLLEVISDEEKFLGDGEQEVIKTLSLPTEKKCKIVKRLYPRRLHKRIGNKETTLHGMR